MKDKLQKLSLSNLLACLALGLALAALLTGGKTGPQGPEGRAGGVTKVDELAAGDKAVSTLKLEIASATSTVFARNNDRFSRLITRVDLLTSGTSTVGSFRVSGATTTRPIGIYATTTSGPLLSGGGGEYLPTATGTLAFAPLLKTGFLATSTGPLRLSATSTLVEWKAGEYIGFVLQQGENGAFCAGCPTATSSTNQRGLGLIEILVDYYSTSTDSTSASRN